MFNRSRFRQRFDGATVAGLTEGTLVAPYVFAAPLTLSRAQTGGVQSSALAADGSSLAFYAADTPRFNGSAQRLLIEGQRTNSIRNPRGEGAIPGTPGTAPTNWGLFGTGGVDFNIVGTGTENNLPYVDIRISGTSTTGNGVLIRADQVYPVAAQNQSWTHSMYARLVSGTLTGTLGFYVTVTEWTSGGAFLDQSSNVYTLTSGALSGARLAHTRTLANATAGLAGSQFGFAVSVGVPIDCTFRVASPQLKLGAFADTDIFPPVGTPGASTRGGELSSATLANLGIAANGACTVLWSGVISNFIAGGVHTIACLDDGSVNNRFTMSFDQASGQLQSMRALAGASATANAGAITAGVPFKGGMNIDGAGRAGVSLNGAAVAAVTSGPISGLTQFRLGNIFDASTPMFGETARLRVLPYSVSDATLQSLVSALP